MSHFTRRQMIAAPFLLAASTMPVFAAGVPLRVARINASLQKMGVVESGFTQISQDQSISRGTILMQRPGKMRFDYEGDDSPLVLVSAGQIGIFDGKRDRKAEIYPLNKTPLSLLLDRTVDLADPKFLRSHSREGDITSVVLADRSAPQRGSVELKVSEDPVEIRQIITTNEAREKTTLILDAFREIKPQPLSRFSISAEEVRRGRM